MKSNKYIIILLFLVLGKSNIYGRLLTEIETFKKLSISSICSVSEIEKQALIALYNATDGANWTNKWDLTKPVCEWYGVSVVNEGVIRVSLAGNNMVGTVPKEIGKLSKLIDLNLASNNLSGGIPNELGNLSTLKFLNLSDNNLTGIIPSELGNNLGLTRIGLSGNQLEGKAPIFADKSLFLTQYDLKDNRFIFNDLKDYFIAFKNKVRSLNYFPQAKVDKIETKSVKIGSSITLTSNVLINPNNNYQWFKDGRVIAGETQKNLVINNASLKDKGNYHFTATNNIVTGLTLIRNTITLEVTEPVDTCGVSEIEKQALIALYNSTNGANWTNTWDLTKPVCDWYGVTVFQNKVTNLALNSNNLVGSIPSSIGNLSNLLIISLYKNQITGTIPSSLEKLLNLTTLSLYSNKLSGTIPPELGNLPLLRQILLSNNSLTGEIPSSLGNLLNLKGLWLQGNKLSGMIPLELGNLSNLELINLSGNKLEGKIPFTINKSPKITYFIIQNNQFVFNGFENNFVAYQNSIQTFSYSPQAKVDIEETLSVELGKSITLTSAVLASLNNSYQWYKDGVAIAGATSKNFTISNVADADKGIYHFTATNSIVTDLTLTRNTVTLEVTEPTDTCGVSEIEKQALIALYNSTDGANWTNTWDLTKSVCDWYGVTVVDNKVTKILLDKNNLVGVIPKEIGNLSSILFLFLSNNLLTEEIPKTIGNLSKLISLKLDRNNLQESIPIEISNLSNLESLTLSNNKLTGSIPKELGNLSKLVNLNLALNSLTGFIPSELQNLIKLRQLYLNSNDLTGSIPKELGSIDVLEIILLNNNSLTGKIPVELGKIKTIKSLFLFNNQLTGEIPSELGNLSELVQILLNNNSLIGEIPLELGNLSNLEVINLSGNNLEGKIPFTINKSPNIAQLQIENNQFIFNDFENNFGAYQNISNGFSYSPQAKVDKIETKLVKIASSITLTSNVLINPKNNYQWFKDGRIIAGETQKNLVINNASLKDKGNYHFTATNNIITGLTLIRNTITLEVTEGIDTCGVSEIEKQALLALYNATDGANWKNKWDLTKPVCEWYGVSVVNKSVIRISLAGNNMVGTIPKEIGKLSKLIYLNLGGNSLSGGIPNEIGNLTSLNSLELHHNKLTGSIPKEIGKLSNLAGMHLGNNSLSGVIPKELGNLTSLKSLYLYSNLLTGSIPKEIGQLSKLNSLSLNTNSLSGFIPKEIGNITSLDNLSLYKNNLTGFIPKEIGKLQNLTSLNLGKNSLSGSIPVEIGNIKILKTLLLSENNLEGEIPTSFEKLINLRLLFLYSNRLQGRIPIGLGNLSKLENIHLSKNKFSKKLPHFRSDVLKQITISYNNFVFSDFENEYLYYKNRLKHLFQYTNQAKVDITETLSVVSGNSITLTSNVLTSVNNSYQWYKNNVAITGATGKDLVIENATDANAGIYHFRANNSIVTGLILTRNPITLKVTSCPTQNIISKLLVNPISSNSIELNWSVSAVGDNTYYEIAYGKLLEVNLNNPTTYKTVKVFTRRGSQLITGLEASVGYGFYIKYQCQNNELYVGPIEVTTLNDSINVDIDIEAIKATPGTSFRPMYEKKYVVSGWVKENYNDGKPKSEYKNSMIRLYTLALENDVLSPPVFINDFYAKGAVIDGWQRIEEIFIIKTPDNGEMVPNNLIIELVNKSSEATSYFDDIRIFPINGSMKSFVYDNKTKKLMAELDENNFATYYEYDKEGGLVRVKKETTKGVYTIQETRSSNVKSKKN
ncbi:leucine-rich repeat domain-containing protein [Tenacibaculum ovolyticum]|uniref:leucine-rich repeat domain-containing protein n=1 Tax=Tenacibaculum ovolyticum TaxID=104270 RepID=UPI0007ECF561|nr:immunoglobulin domain-containing protein [Tenacibaculum ovolyticum]